MVKKLCNQTAIFKCLTEICFHDIFWYVTAAVHLKHPGSTYSAPVYVKKASSTIGSGKVLQVTGDLTGKHPHPRDSRKSTSESAYNYAGSGYGTYRKSRLGSGGTLRRKLIPKNF